MSRAFAKRVDDLEDALVIGEERQQFERWRRFHYNLQLVSMEALRASIDAGQKGLPTPDWAEAEFQAPIPADAYPERVRDAERMTRESMRACFHWANLSD